MFAMCTAVAGRFSVFITELSDRKTNALDTDRKWNHIRSSACETMQMSSMNLTLTRCGCMCVSEQLQAKFYAECHRKMRLIYLDIFRSLGYKRFAEIQFSICDAPSHHQYLWQYTLQCVKVWIPFGQSAGSGWLMLV